MGPPLASCQTRAPGSDEEPARDGAAPSGENRGRARVHGVNPPKKLHQRKRDERLKDCEACLLLTDCGRRGGQEWSEGRSGVGLGIRSTRRLAPILGGETYLQIGCA